MVSSFTVTDDAEQNGETNGEEQEERAGDEPDWE